ncbi:MAG: TonB-dependent receptor [Pseudomonadales bacterium]|nr:TonB-dependent receptor [Pseudomonadales bacterium]
MVTFVLVANSIMAAEQASYHFDIPQQSADKALTALARQADTQVLFQFDVVKQFITKSVSGEYTIEEAITLLFKDTGLKGVFSEQGSIVVKVDESKPDSSGGEEKMNRKLTFGSAIAAFFTGVFAVQGVSAQQAETENSRSRTTLLEEVIVTATKREQSLQDVSEAVSSVSSDRLRDAHIQTLSDLQNIVPNVSFGDDFGIAKLTIRGIGTNLSTEGIDTGVSLYVDGAVLSRPWTQFSSLFDLSRVEVLRGPQGTLFGRNAVGGAVNLVTAKPTEEFESFGRLTVGKYAQFDGEGAVSGPIYSDKILGRVAFQLNERNGFGENVTSGNDIDDQNRRMARTQFQFNITEDLDFLLMGEWFREDDNSNSLKLKEAAFPDIPELTPIGAGGFASGVRDIAGDFDPVNVIETWAVGGTLNYILNDQLSIKNIANYRKSNSRFSHDLDLSTVVNSLATNGGATQGLNRELFSRQVSDELQLNYDGDRLKGIFGFYFFSEDFGGGFSLGLTPTLGQNGNPPRIVQDVGNETADAWAVFFDTTFDITDQIALKVGGRFNHEVREVTNGATILLSDGAGPPIRLGNSDKRTFKDFTPKAGIEWRPFASENAMLYYTHSQGFKSGAGEITILSPGIIQPETIKNHEFGLRSSWFDRRLIVNLSGFFYNLKDLQVERTMTDPLAGFVSVFENAAKVDAHGIETEVTLLATEQFSLSAAGTYLHSTFGEFTTSNPSDARNIVGSPVFAPIEVDLSGNFTRYSPKWAFNIHPAYDIPFANGGSVTIASDFSYKSRQFHTEFNDLRFSSGAYTLIDAQIRYTPVNESWSFEVWGKNLSGKRESSGSFLVNNNVAGSLIAPTTVGVSVGYNY